MQDFLARTDLITVDQAHGLRRMFRGDGVHFVALVSNPFVEHAGVGVERLTAALALHGRRVLVVDAGEASPELPEEGVLDLAACIEKLSPRVQYLPARGLPRRHVDARGSAAALLHTLAESAPGADVILIHASAAELSRIFSDRPLRPVLLAAEDAGSIQHAYAALKLLTRRACCASFDLLLLAPPASSRLPRIADSVATCAERYAEAALREWAAAHPSAPATDPPEKALLRIAASHLDPEDVLGEAAIGSVAFSRSGTRLQRPYAPAAAGAFRSAEEART